MEIRIKNQKKVLILGFASTIIMVVVLGIASHAQLNRMANTMNLLYSHPYIVSNTTQEIKFNLVSMQRYMRSAVLAKSDQDLDELVSLIASHEEEVFKRFDLLSERFLGEKNTINESYRMVVQWQPIRGEIIRLARTKNSPHSLAIARQAEGAFMQTLLGKIQLINDFANKKAASFQQAYIKEKQQALWVNYVLSFFTILFILMLAIRMIKKTDQYESDRCDKEHLIDQSIMLAKLDKNGVVLDISNALCRFLDKNKTELLGENSHFFDNSKRAEKVNNTILSVLKTGAEWRGEIQYINPEGKACWAQSTIVPCYDKAYQISHFTNTLVNITNNKLALIDELTSLLNRRGFDAILSREFLHVQRDNANLSLAILDIDYFKKFNDLYGHPKGDEALRQVSGLIHENVDESCFAFRIGGEEFAMIFVGHSLGSTRQLLHRLKDRVERLQIPHAHNQVSDALTLSIGALVITPEDNVEERRLYSLADKALYQAKQQRNNVVVSKYQASEPHFNLTPEI